MKADKPSRPARLSERIVLGNYGEFETTEFAIRRDKRRRKKQLEKASRKANRR